MEANSEDAGTGGAQRSALPASALVGATRDVITIDAAAACVILVAKDSLTCGRQRDHLL